MKGFKDFILRGNLVELAVAVVIGTAFAAVIKSFTQIILDIVGKVGGSTTSFSAYKPGGVQVGDFITTFITFLIVAAVVYFLVVLPYNKFREMREKNVDAKEDPTELDLLVQIRDELQARPHN